MTSTPITGGCLCGAVRYAYDGPVGPASYCHCADCRRVTGSAFNVGVRVDLHAFRVLRGEVRRYTKAADSGHSITRAFCADCGSPLFTASPVHPAHLYVKAGSLDDPTLVNPSHQSWTDSAVAWGHIDATLPSYPRGRR